MKKESTLNPKISLHKKNVYEISPNLLPLLEELKVELNEQYINNLLTYAHPLWENKSHYINLLIKEDYWNHILYSQKGFGCIIQCTKEGKPIQTFNDLQSVIFSNEAEKYIYTFQKFIKEKKYISRCGVDFFGVNFLPLYDQMSNENFAINFLNYSIKDILNWKTGKRAKDSYRDYRKREKEYSFQLFVEQYLKSRAYDFGRVITYWMARANRTRATRINRDKVLYKKSLTDVIDRYYIENISLLEKVENLNRYDFSGIYILCYDDFCGYYVGQTSISIKKRIRRHYQQLNSDFDKLYGHNDVKAIYALNCPSNMLNRIEQDIIASIPSEFLLNGLAGGTSIESIAETNNLFEKYAFTFDELEIVKWYLYKEKNL